MDIKIYMDKTHAKLITTSRHKRKNTGKLKIESEIVSWDAFIINFQ